MSDWVWGGGAVVMSTSPRGRFRVEGTFVELRERGDRGVEGLDTITRRGPEGPVG